MTADLKIIANLAGHLITMLVALALIAGVCYLQWFEYRRSWPNSKGAYWLVKLGTLAVGSLIVGLGVLVATGISGMEALGVFYLGLFIGIIGAPFLTAQLCRIFGLPAADSMRLSVSIVVLVLVFWFAGSAVVGSGVALKSVDYAKRKDYLQLQSAEAKAPDATGEIRFLKKDQWRLPDGKRLIHMAFAIAPEFQLRKQEVKLARDWGRSEEYFRGTLGGCFTDGVYHMTNVLAAAQEITVRIVVYDGRGETMRSLTETYQFPDDPASVSGYFQVYEDAGRITLPVSVPARRVFIVGTDGQQPLLSKLPTAETGGVAGSHPNGRCAPLEFSGNIEIIKAEFYAEESYQHFSYQFVPKQVAPEFR